MAEALEKAALDFEAKAVELTAVQPIRITAYSGNFSPRMTAIVNEFSALHPKVTFEFLPAVKTLDLLANEADIALRLVRAEPDDRLICRKISTARWSLFGGHSYAETYGLPDSPDRLSGHKFVTFERDDVPNVFHEWLVRHVSPDQIVMSFSELELMHAAIRAGHGLGISNVKLMETDRTLVRCFDEIKELAAPHMLLAAPQAYKRPEIKAFIKFFAPRYAAIFK
ncbi:LysR substrate-binding domain-containing protein [Aliisedimentitalea scapharcae]|uniref:LysR substrate-binding domain-containing protein n=1 Tax=Aliisedimentitalea scapharcae TaxID=1524259 RepID=A0ABZ2XRR2_9RHOB